MAISNSYVCLPEGIDNNNESEYPLNDGSIETTKTNPKTKTPAQEIKRSVYRLQLNAHMYMYM